MTVTISNLSVVSSPFLRRIVSLGTAFRQPASAGGLFCLISWNLVSAPSTPVSVAMKRRNCPTSTSTVSSMTPCGGIQSAVMLTMAAMKANQMAIISFA